MKIKKPHPENKVMWAYFAPDGYIQVRSIADTKKLAREMITRGYTSWADYEREGYYLRKVRFKISIIL